MPRLVAAAERTGHRGSLRDGQRLPESGRRGGVGSRRCPPTLRQHLRRRAGSRETHHQEHTAERVDQPARKRKQSHRPPRRQQRTDTRPEVRDARRRVSAPLHASVPNGRPSVRQREHEQVVAEAGAELGGQVQEAAVAGADGDVLAAVYGVGDREAGDG